MVEYRIASADGVRSRYGDIGRTVSKGDYEAVEAALLHTVRDFADHWVGGIAVTGLEDPKGKARVRNGQQIVTMALAAVLQGILRGHYWCRVEAEAGFVHVSRNELALFLGVLHREEALLDRAHKRGLIVEEAHSPYHEDS